MLINRQVNEYNMLSILKTKSRKGILQLGLVISFVLFLNISVFSQVTNYKRVDTAISKIDSAALQKEDFLSTKDSAEIQQELGNTTYLKNRFFIGDRNIQQQDNVAAVSTIYAKDVSTTPVRDITNVMAGRISGLYTLQTSGQTGADAASFLLRGQSPLFVIDGVVRSFTDFNPNDIKSITILKGALASAMYGIRSSNGVISIETKDKGERNFELHFSAQGGISSPTVTPKILNAYDYAKLYDKAQLNDNPSATPKYTDSLLNAYQNGTNDPFLSPNVNWYNVVKKYVNIQHYNIDMSGYGKSYHYFASLENFNQGGNFVTSPINTYNTNNKFNRYNIRLNASVDFNKDISLDIRLFGSIANSAEPGSSIQSIMSSIYSTPPLAYPVFNPDGSLGGSTIFTNNIDGQTLHSGYLLENSRTVTTDVKLKYKLDDLLKGLWASGLVSINNQYHETINREKSFAIYQYSPPQGGNPASYLKIGSDGTVGNGSYTLNSQYTTSYYNIQMGLDRGWAKSKLHILGAYNVENDVATLNQLNEIYRTASITANYSYDDKYIAELSSAYSGLNYYPPGHRYAFLPSIGLGWIISKESFFNANTVNFLKLRASIGQTANGNPGYFSYIQNYIINGSGTNIGATSTNVTTAYENGIANPNITWEKAWKGDVGLEMAMFDSKFSSNIDYYYNRYYDQLITPPEQSGIFGNTYPQINVGKTRYSGLELALGYNNNDHKVQYSINGNVSIAANKVLYADDPRYPYSWMYHSGIPSGTMFGYQAIGFYQTGDDFQNIPHIDGYTPQAGDIKYKDLNGDGVINFLDEKPLGTTAPLITYGLNGRISYKGFDINVLFQGVQNSNLYINPTSPLIQEFQNGNGIVQAIHLDSWTPQTASTAIYPRLTIGGNSNNTAASSFWMKNGSYVRLKNVEVGYSVPQRWLNHAKFRQIRIFVNAYNLVTWAHLSAWNLDPETGVNSYFADPRVINAGISLKL
ncbi:SusC/RagA family TonB-linked outer membrane protein [Arachidicoccus soli]|uniref:SusC/RagA family TonB-linked outer membrane protein n=1 Tax=Arachidicoccus soli TaxID=2341117 RepID=A0A386HR46_9BACT|nr:SusC/RagA family TonB-linked outer membrane protein [Arachidicoccus soli]AYD48437.1 SusC/RagA family TonB-linked outer membrane protein [Arachidicoccus soli]